MQSINIEQFGINGNKTEKIFPRIRLCFLGNKTVKKSKRTGI
jgi:hypothetical protein